MFRTNKGPDESINSLPNCRKQIGQAFQLPESIA